MIQKRLSGFLERASHLSKTEDSVLNAVDSVIEACVANMKHLSSIREQHLQKNNLEEFHLTATRCVFC